MNTSRIEIPLTLAPPRFEDESTVATARQVKPIGRAKVTFGLRKVRAILPLMFAATLCGALGAATVNYYERHRQVESAAAPKTPVTTATQPAPMAFSASSELSGGKLAENQTGAAPAKDSDAKTEEATKQAQANAKPETEALLARRKDEPRESTTLKILKKSDSEPAKLTRRRRVRPVDEPASKNGAGRIADLFSSPNP